MYSIHILTYIYIHLYLWHASTVVNKSFYFSKCFYLISFEIRPSIWPFVRPFVRCFKGLQMCLFISGNSNDLIFPAKPVYFGLRISQLYHESLHRVQMCFFDKTMNEIKINQGCFRLFKFVNHYREHSQFSRRLVKDFDNVILLFSYCIVDNKIFANFTVSK